MHQLFVASSDEFKQTVKGWGASVTLHACLAMAAFGLMPKMAVLVQQEPFTWEVALIDAPGEVPRSEESAPIPQVQPAPPVKSQRQPVRAVQTPPEVVQRAAETRNRPQPVQPVPETTRPQQQIPPPQEQEVVQVQPKQIEPPEAQKIEQLTQAAIPAAVKEAVSPVEQNKLESAPVTAQTYETQPVVSAPPVVETKPEPTVTASAPAAPAAPMPEREQPSAAPAQTMETFATASEPSAPSPSAPAETMTTTPPPGTAGQQDPSTMSEHQVVASAVMPKAASNSDYKWVAESLTRRVIELRHYPSTAKLNGWEGKVVLKVSIGPDGHLKGVEVVESSGHDALDQAAIEVVRRACPLHMKHEVTAPLVVMKLPVVYKLSR
jgi:protein TonB